jgi:hypothetical protein
MQNSRLEYKTEDQEADMPEISETDLADLLGRLRGSRNEHVEDITIERAALSADSWKEYPDFPSVRSSLHEPNGSLIVERLPCRFLPRGTAMHFYFRPFCLGTGKDRTTNIASLEIRNPLRWRSDAVVHNVKALSSDAHRMGAFIQSRGTVVPPENACARCSKGFGAWTECISIDDGGSAACGNCTKMGKGGDCELRMTIPDPSCRRMPMTREAANGAS